MSKEVKGQSILLAIKDIVKSDTEAYWILWKYAPDLLPDVQTFEDLKKKHVKFANLTEEFCSKYIYKEDVQAGIKFLLKRLNTKRDIEIYNKYFDLAMNGDVQALKAYMDFKKEFFEDGEIDELKSILANASIYTNDSDIDDINMEF